MDKPGKLRRYGTQPEEYMTKTKYVPDTTTCNQTQITQTTPPPKNQTKNNWRQRRMWIVWSSYIIYFIKTKVNLAQVRISIGILAILFRPFDLVAPQHIYITHVFRFPVFWLSVPHEIWSRNSLFST